MSTEKSQSNKQKGAKAFFERFAKKATVITGGPGAFLGAVGFVLTWALLGPVFDFSEPWQLVINTSTTIMTFLMVFLIQHTQNKDAIALQMKLNELISVTKEANNHLIGSEDFTDDELKVVQRYYDFLAQEMKLGTEVEDEFSIAMAQERHLDKMGHRKQDDNTNENTFADD